MLQAVKKFKFLILSAVIAAGILAWVCPQAKAANNGNTSGYAWSERVGWIRFDGTGSSHDYGVTVGDTILTGYAWSENAGWIHMASTSASCVQPGGDCASGYAYNVAATTDCSIGWKCLSGYAWGEGVGWISFATSTTDYSNASASTYGVYIDNNNNFQGYAWGEQVGWIHFSGSCSESGNCPGGEDTYGVIYPTIGTEQQINIIDQNYNNDTAGYLPNDNSLGLIKWDGSKYDGESVYFEAVLNDGTSWHRIRDDTDLSSTLSDNTNYTVRIKLDTNCYASLYSEAGAQVAASEISTSTASDCFIKAARLIIVQSNATEITKTVTMIEVGDATSTEQTSMTQLQDKKIYLYDHDQFDPEPTAYFEASLKTSCGYSNTITWATSSISSATGVEDTEGSDDADWTGHANVYSSDASRAEISLGKNFVKYSYYLKANGTAFSAVPATAQLQGVQVRIERSYTIVDGADDTIRDEKMYLVKADAIQGTWTNKADTVTDWPAQASESYAYYGGATDKWGGASNLTISDIKNSNFGVAIKANLIVGAGEDKQIDAKINHIEIAVAYKAQNIGCAACAELYNKTNSAVVAGSSISTTSTSWVLVRGASALSTDWDTDSDDEYVVRIRNDTSGASTYIANAKIILEQIDPGGVIDKVEMVHQYINTKASESAGSWTAQNFKNLYNADNFSNGTFTYYFEATLKDNTSTSAARLNPGSLGAVGGSFADYTRSSSTSITLVDDTDYDSEIQYADVSSSWLVIRALGLRPVIAPYVIENIITIEGDIKFD